MSNRTLTASLLALVLAVAACADDDTTTAPEAAAPPVTEAPADDPEPAPDPPDEPEPEPAPEPDPEPEPEARFEPIELRGTGQDVIDLGEIVTDPLLARMTHRGSSNFQVAVLDDNGERAGGLANHIGDYDGTVPVNFSGRDDFRFVEIGRADGEWTIIFDSPVTALAAGTASGDGHDGRGDQVVFFDVDGPTMVEITCPACDSNFQVTAWGERRNGLVNEIGAYTGTVLVPAGTVLVEVAARYGRGEPPPEWTLAVQ